MNRDLRRRASLLLLILTAPCSALHAQSTRTAFEDAFDNGDLLVNPGAGGGWVLADQGGGPDAELEYSEAGGRAILPSSSGGWNIGGIKTTNRFLPGATVTVVLSGIEVVDDTSSPADRGNGLQALLQAQISVTDGSNNQSFPSAFKNDGKPGMNIEIQVADGVWGFDIQHQGGGNDSSVMDSAGVFDEPITEQSPLEATIVVDGDGSYTVTFNKARDGGATDPLTGSLGASVADLKVALGTQGINGNTGYARFDHITIVEPLIQDLRIVTQPADQFVLSGATATFSVSAAGSGTLTYQWLKGQQPLAGQTNGTLTITNVQQADAGEYSVRVSDSVASITSDPATLGVLLLNSEFDDDFANNQPLTNPGTGGGWLAADQAEPYEPHAEAASTLTLYSGASGWNLGGIKTANGFVPGTILRATLSAFLLTGDNGFRANRGNALNGAAIAHFTLSDINNTKPYPNAFHNDEVGGVDVEIVLRDDGSAGYAVFIPVYDGNPNSAGSTITSSGDLDWDGASPFDITASLEADGTFLVRFSVPHDGGSTSPLAGNVGRPVAAFVAALGVQGVSDNLASVAFSRVQTVDAAAEAPIIAVPPSGGYVIGGRPLTLSVSAIGSAPLAYEWRKNGTPIPGATQATLELPSPGAADAGRYSVRVSNSVGESVSDEIELRIAAPGILFEDVFEDGDPLVNPGTGGDWVLADQGGSPDDGVEYSESEGVVALPTSSGGWNIGGIKTTNIFPAGARVTAVLKGIDIVDGSGSPGDRGNGVQALVQAQVSVTDGANAESFPSAYKNDNKPGMNVEIQSDGTNWGFDIQHQGGANNGSVTDSAFKLDGPVTAENPLTLSIVVDSAGNYEVTFSAPYDGGKTAPLTGTLGRGFAGNAFLVALGSQGINENTGHSLFDRLSVVAETVSTPPSLDIAREGGEIILTWTGNALLEVSPGLPGSWSAVANAASGHRVSTAAATAQYYRLRLP